MVSITPGIEAWDSQRLMRILRNSGICRAGRWLVWVICVICKIVRVLVRAKIRVICRVSLVRSHTSPLRRVTHHWFEIFLSKVSTHCDEIWQGALNRISFFWWARFFQFVAMILKPNLDLNKKVSYQAVEKFFFKVLLSSSQTRVPLNSTQTPSVQHIGFTQGPHLFCTQKPSVQHTLHFRGVLVWNWGVFGVEPRGFRCGTGGFLGWNWRVCWTEAFSVWKWAI